MTWKCEELIELLGMVDIGDEMLDKLRAEARQKTALPARVRPAPRRTIRTDPPLVAHAGLTRRWWRVAAAMLSRSRSVDIDMPRRSRRSGVRKRREREASSSQKAASSTPSDSTPPTPPHCRTNAPPCVRVRRS